MAGLGECCFHNQQLREAQSYKHRAAVLWFEEHPSLLLGETIPTQELHQEIKVCQEQGQVWLPVILRALKALSVGQAGDTNQETAHYFRLREGIFILPGITQGNICCCH